MLDHQIMRYYFKLTKVLLSSDDLVRKHVLKAQSLSVSFWFRLCFLHTISAENCANVNNRQTNLIKLSNSELKC